MSGESTKPLLPQSPGPPSDSDYLRDLVRPHPKQVKDYGAIHVDRPDKPGRAISAHSKLRLIREPVGDGEPIVFDDEVPLQREAFCKLIGIRPTASYGSTPSELESGAGLYHDIRVAYNTARGLHFWFEMGVYTALLLQVLLSANFIILGAMHGDHHVSIAVLGAISVSIAGCLALVKGQGLPMRIRMERDALWKVQLGAEELNWQMAAGKPVMFGDVKRIWERFIEVKKDASLNHPDTWNTSTTAAAQPVAVSSKLGSGPSGIPGAVTTPATAEPRRLSVDGTLEREAGQQAEQPEDTPDTGETG